MLMRRNVTAGIGSNEQGEYCRAALQRSDHKEPRYKSPTLLYFTYLLTYLLTQLYTYLYYYDTLTKLRILQFWTTEKGSIAQIKNVFEPITVGSRSTKMARGTLCPDPVSLKNVELESDDMAAVWLPSTDNPSGWIPCSRQYSSQQELPIWTPAWPT